jgi:hypothetical protein
VATSIDAGFPIAVVSCDPRVGDPGWEANLFPTGENKGNEIFLGPKTQGKFSLVPRLLRAAIALFPTKANEGNEVWDLSFLLTFCSESRGSKKTSNFF